MRVPSLTSVRAKIMVTIFAVSVVLLVFGAWAAFNAATATTGRSGMAFDRLLERYRANLVALGSNDYALVRIIATDPALTAALGSGDGAQLADAAKRVIEPL